MGCRCQHSFTCQVEQQEAIAQRVQQQVDMPVLQPLRVHTQALQPLAHTGLLLDSRAAALLGAIPLATAECTLLQGKSCASNLGRIRLCNKTAGHLKTNHTAGMDDVCSALSDPMVLKHALYQYLSSASQSRSVSWFSPYSTHLPDWSADMGCLLPGL